MPQQEKQRPYSDLKQDIQSKEWHIRSSALVEIISNGYKEAIPDLRKILKNDPHPSVKSVAAIGLGEFQDRESTLEIIETFRKDKTMSPDALIDALKRMQDPRGANAILPFLESEEDSIRLITVDALFEMKAEKSGKEILKMAERNKNSEKVKTYSMVLGKLGIKEAENYLLKQTSQLEPSPALAAVYLALGRIKSKKAIPTLSSAIGKDFSKGRENSVQALIQIKDPSCLPFLYDYLESQDREIRLAGSEVIGEFPSPKTEEILLKILSSNETSLYGTNAMVAGKIRSEKNRKRIEEIFQIKEIMDRELIGQSLGWIGNKESIPVLVKVLDEANGEGRYGAAWSLGILKAESAFENLAKAASSSDKKLASIALESIGHLQLEKSISLLENSIQNDKNLAVFALSSISTIPGENARKSLEKHAGLNEPTIYRPAIEFLGKRKEKESVVFLIDQLKKGNGDKNKILLSALSSITGKKMSSSEWISSSEN